MATPIIVGAGGLTGWRILKNTEARQLDTLAKDSVVQRSTAYFRENISTASTAAELVGNYKLLSVALGAYGLEEDIASKAFIRKVLESDIGDDDSLVNRLGDKRYRRLAEAFGYGTSAGVSTTIGERVSDAYLQREFERRVGEGDENLRLALNTRRELQQFAGRDASNNTLWYEVLGNPPLRKVFEGAFGFGSSYGTLSIDRQLEEFTKASERFLGTASFKDLSTEEGTDRLIRNFLARSQLQETTIQNRYSAALTLLSG